MGLQRTGSNSKNSKQRESQGKAGSLHLIFPHRGHGINDSEGYTRPTAIGDEEWQELRKFRSDLPFTIAKLEDGVAVRLDPVPLFGKNIIHSDFRLTGGDCRNRLNGRRRI
jgi:hypothetical protein